MSQAKGARDPEILRAVVKQFVPEDGISRAVLEDKLHVYFPKGAQIAKQQIRLTPTGPAGWLIAGGIVTESIIAALRRDTLRETDPSSYRSIRDIDLAWKEAFASNPIQESPSNVLNDRHRAPHFPTPPSSFLSTDEKPTVSPTGTRHQKTDPKDSPRRKTVSFADPAIAVKYPGHEQFTEENFVDYQGWKEFLRLKGQYANLNRHQNVPASSVVPPRPPYQPVDVAANSRQPQSGRDAGERNQDASAPLGYIQTQGRHGRHEGNDRRTENDEDPDSDDEPSRRRKPAVCRRRHADSDSDSDSDVILQEVVRKTPWSRTVTTTKLGSRGHSSRRRRGRQETVYIVHEK